MQVPTISIEIVRYYAVVTDFWNMGFSAMFIFRATHSICVNSNRRTGECSGSINKALEMKLN